MPRLASTQINDSPQAAAITRGVLSAYEAEGYVLADGSKDIPRVREHVFEALTPHKVLNWRDRDAKAITRGALVQQVFPSLLGPDRFSEADDPQLAKAVWDKIYSDLWSQLTPGAGGPVQRLVGLNMGNGYVLCRTQIGIDSTDAVYITDDRQCIERDYLVPDNTGLQRKIEAVTRNREMLIMRQPGNARRYAQGFDARLKALAAGGHDRLALAVEASSVNGSDAAETDEAGEN